VTPKPHTDQEFLHAFIDGAEPGWDASVRYDAHEKVRNLFEQLEAARADLHDVWDLIWNQDGAYIEGGDRMLDEWAQKVRPRYGFEASDPALRSE
jgi:hypothetical protein